MKKALFTLCILSLLAGCKPDAPAEPNLTIDHAIIGSWQVSYSQTIKGVRMAPNGSLEVVGNKQDTLTFFGEPNTPISSYMFGTKENIIDIREDNKINVFLINNRGGVTITTDRTPYYVRNDTLFGTTPKFENAHKYRLQNDSLVIERIPSENTGWTYIYSKYFRRML